LTCLAQCCGDDQQLEGNLARPHQVLSPIASRPFLEFRQARKDVPQFGIGLRGQQRLRAWLM